MLSCPATGITRMLVTRGVSRRCHGSFMRLLRGSEWRRFEAFDFADDGQVGDDGQERRGGNKDKRVVEGAGAA